MAGRKKADRASMRERLCARFDIMPDVFPDEMLIEIRGRNMFVLRGRGKIRSYSNTEVILSVRGGNIHVCGRRLFCSDYSNSATKIDGYICSVSFE